MSISSEALITIGIYASHHLKIKPCTVLHSANPIGCKIYALISDPGPDALYDTDQILLTHYHDDKYRLKWSMGYSTKFNVLCVHLPGITTLDTTSDQIIIEGEEHSNDQ